MRMTALKAVSRIVQAKTTPRIYFAEPTAEGQAAMMEAFYRAWFTYSPWA